LHRKLLLLNGAHQIEGDGLSLTEATALRHENVEHRYIRLWLPEQLPGRLRQIKSDRDHRSLAGNGIDFECAAEKLRLLGNIGEAEASALYGGGIKTTPMSSSPH
jgi:hypothetical protein